jgi:hypothetical protein
MEIYRQIIESAKDAYTNEENELNNYFEKNNEYYYNRHHGLGQATEPIFVYLLFKELIKNKISYKVNWEYPYPYSNKKQRLDLYLEEKKENKTTKSIAIEVKIIETDNDKRIIEDIMKLHNFKQNCIKILLLISFYNNSENLKNNIQNKLSDIKIRFIKQGEFTLKLYDQKSNSHKMEDVLLLLFKLGN